MAAGGGGTGFSATEKKKLEQAGLSNAPRQDQLDFLYGNTEKLSNTELQTKIEAGLKANNAFGTDKTPGATHNRVSWETYLWKRKRP